jgi:hypothetical protein
MAYKVEGPYARSRAEVRTVALQGRGACTERGGKRVPQAIRSGVRVTYRCYLHGPDGFRELAPCGPGAEEV